MNRGRLPRILPVRERAALVNQLLAGRLQTLLEPAMRETGFDMWLVICQEDNLDPVFTTLIPMDTWCPILQMLVFFDRGEVGVERLNLSMTNTQDLYERPWKGQHHEEQWPLLCQVIEERDPQRIGINIGSVEWAAGGLTHNLYQQLVAHLPQRYVDRLESAEPLATRWLAVLSDEELVAFGHVVNLAHTMLAECYSRATIVPGVTTTDDLQWAYWQRAADLGLDLAFRPFFNLVRSDEMWERYGREDCVIRPGDMIHSDVGVRYLRLNSDHQQWAYILRPGEDDAPAGLKNLMWQANRLQDVFMDEFRQGLTGNELLANILTRAQEEGIPQPRVYSHNLGFFLHEPGPLIGLPWEQERCVGRGDVALEYNNTFTMELSITDRVPEWEDQEVRFSIEEDVAYTKDLGCWPMDGRQMAFYLV
jgi:Xaa-Pro aminopeptidase